MDELTTEKCRGLMCDWGGDEPSGEANPWRLLLNALIDLVDELWNADKPSLRPDMEAYVADQMDKGNHPGGEQWAENSIDAIAAEEKYLDTRSTPPDFCCYPNCKSAAEWELIGVGTRELDHTHACTEHIGLLLQVDTQEYRLTRIAIRAPTT